MAQQPVPPPDDVLYLSSSDDEPTPSKKRSLEDDSDSSSEAEISMARYKRARKESPAKRKTSSDSADVEEGEIDEESKEAQSAPSEPSTSEQKSDAQASTDATSVIFFPPKGPVFKHNGMDLKLPVFSQKREGNWDERFGDWAQAFCTGNTGYGANVNSTTVVAAYNWYLDAHSGIKNKKKKSAKQAAKAFMSSGSLKAMLKSTMPKGKPVIDPKPKTRSAAASRAPQESEEEYEPTIQEHEIQKPEATPAAPVQPVPVLEPQGVNGTQQTQTETDDFTLQLQRRYFPSAKDPSSMCLLCGHGGHTSPSCSNTTCKFCGSREHWGIACPTRSRCGKCRQLGHGSDHCEEKLALTKSDGLACSFCESADHLEDECTMVWRSFIPGQEAITQVAFIAPSCSRCGSAHHYFSDCPGLRETPKNPTWSLRNRDMYIDQNSENMGIEDAAARSSDKQKTQVPQMNIRGHASRTNNVHYSSDDSDVEFLGNKPSKKRAPLGQIRMASNIQMPSEASGSGPRGNSRRGPPGQPPLPPGPPPPGPPPGQARGRPPPVPPPSLPARPPSRDRRGPPPPRGNQRNTFTDMMRPNGHGPSGGNPPGRGGRGGGRGGGGRGGRGGRGRGRGKR